MTIILSQIIIALLAIEVVGRQDLISAAKRKSEEARAARRLHEEKLNERRLEHTDRSLPPTSARINSDSNREGEILNSIDVNSTIVNMTNDSLVIPPSFDTVEANRTVTKSLETKEADTDSLTSRSIHTTRLYGTDAAFSGYLSASDLLIKDNCSVRGSMKSKVMATDTLEAESAELGSVKVEAVTVSGVISSGVLSSGRIELRGGSIDVEEEFVSMQKRIAKLEEVIDRMMNGMDGNDNSCAGLLK